MGWVLRHATSAAVLLVQPPPHCSIPHLSHLASMQPTNSGGFSQSGQQSLPSQGGSAAQVSGPGQSGAQAQGVGGGHVPSGQEQPGGPGSWGAPQPCQPEVPVGDTSPGQYVPHGGKGSSWAGLLQTTHGKGAAPQWGQPQTWAGQPPTPQPSAGMQMGWGQTPPGMWNPAQAAQQGIAGGGYQQLPPAGRGGRPTPMLGTPSMGVSPGGWSAGPLGYVPGQAASSTQYCGVSPLGWRQGATAGAPQAPPPPPAEQDMGANLEAIAGVYGETVEQQQERWTFLQQQQAELDLAIEMANRQEREVVARKLVEAERGVQQRKQVLQGARHRLAAVTAEQATPMPPPSPQPTTTEEGCCQGSPFFHPEHPLGLAYVPKASTGGPPPKAPLPGVSPGQGQGPGVSQQGAAPVQDQNQGAPMQGVSPAPGQTQGVPQQAVAPTEQGPTALEAPGAGMGALPPSQEQSRDGGAPPQHGRPDWANTPQFIRQEEFAKALAQELRVPWDGIPTGVARTRSGRRIPKGDINTGTDVSERGLLVPSNRIGDMDRYRCLIEELLCGTWRTPHALFCDVFWHIQSLPLHCWVTMADIVLAINSSETGKNSKGKKVYRMALVHFESQFWVCLVRAGWFYARPELFFGVPGEDEGDTSQGEMQGDAARTRRQGGDQGDGQSGVARGRGQGADRSEGQRGGGGPQSDKRGDPWQSWADRKGKASTSGNWETPAEYSGGGYGSGSGRRRSDGGFSHQGKDGTYRGARSQPYGAREEPTDTWTDRDQGPRQESLREKFQHTGPTQARHSKRVGVHVDGNGKTYLWYMDALPMADGEPDYDHPYLWWRQLGFDIPSWEVSALRRLYQEVFGGAFEGLACSQRGRIPGNAAQAEHTNLVNRIHNASNSRWQRHGGTSDDAKGPKFARITREASWPANMPPPYGGGVLPDNWQGEFDCQAGLVEQAELDSDQEEELSSDSGPSPAVVPAGTCMADLPTAQAAGTPEAQDPSVPHAPQRTPEVEKDPASEAKKEEPTDAPTASEPGAAAPVAPAQEPNEEQAAAASTPTAPADTGASGSGSAQELPQGGTPQEEQ